MDISASPRQPSPRIVSCRYSRCKQEVPQGGVCPSAPRAKRLSCALDALQKRGAIDEERAALVPGPIRGSAFTLTTGSRVAETVLLTTEDAGVVAAAIGVRKDWRVTVLDEDEHQDHEAISDRKFRLKCHVRPGLWSQRGALGANS